MNVKLKSKKTPFAHLIEERLAITLELQTFDNVRGLKLTPAAFLREAMEIARMDASRLKKLRAELESKPGLDAARVAMRNMIAAFRSPNWSGPPRELRRLNYLLSANAIAELASMGSTSLELAAVAIQIAGEKHPDDFGTAESTKGSEKRLLELALKRDELDQKIEQAWTAEDIHYGDDFKPTFKLSNGKVPLGPKIAERLIPHLIKEVTNLTRR